MTSNRPARLSDSPGRVGLAAQLALIGVPIYLWQGWRVRRKTPRLCEAPGLRRGVIEGRTPLLRLIGIGESPIAGVGLEDQARTVTARLAGELASSTRRMVHWATAARGGVTAADALDELLPNVVDEPADLVLISLGVNDCLRLRSAHRWKKDLVRLLDDLGQRVNPSTVILAGIPPMQHFPALPRPLATMLGLRARLLDSVSAGLAAQRHDLIHVPMKLDAQNAELFCRDGFHPSAIAHQRWAQQLAPIATSAIEHQSS